MPATQTSKRSSAVEAFLSEGGLSDCLSEEDGCPSRKGQTFQTLDPGTGSVLSTVYDAGNEDVDLAVQTARQAFRSSGWAQMTPNARGVYLHRLADLVEKNKSTLERGVRLVCLGSVTSAPDSVQSFLNWAAALAHHVDYVVFRNLKDGDNLYDYDQTRQALEFWGTYDPDHVTLEKLSPLYQTELEIRKLTITEVLGLTDHTFSEERIGPILSPLLARARLRNYQRRIYEQLDLPDNPARCGFHFRLVLAVSLFASQGRCLVLQHPVQHYRHLQQARLATLPRHKAEGPEPLRHSGSPQ